MTDVADDGKKMDGLTVAPYTKWYDYKFLVVQHLKRQSNG